MHNLLKKITNPWTLSSQNFALMLPVHTFSLWILGVEL